MKLSELQAPFSGRKIIAYARDNTTAVEKNKDLQQVCGNLYKGKNDDDNGQITCRLYVFYEDLNIGMDIGSIYYPDQEDSEKVLSRVPAVFLQEPQAFIKALDHAVEAEQRVTNAYIALARYIVPDRVPVYIAARQRYRDKSDELHAAEWAKQEAEDAAYCEECNAEMQSAIDAALVTIRNGGILKNDIITFYRSRYDSSSYRIINHLARQYGVKFPLKVQGWVNKRLAEVTVQDGKTTQYRYKESRSITFVDYMDQLLAVICQQESGGDAT